MKTVLRIAGVLLVASPAIGLFVLVVMVEGVVVFLSGFFSMLVIVGIMLTGLKLIEWGSR